jgi:hypothetical protein
VALLTLKEGVNISLQKQMPEDESKINPRNAVYIK